MSDVFCLAAILERFFMQNLAAIILAAGEGKRVGKAKWQLLFQGQTFLDCIVSKIISAGIFDIVCVARENSIPLDKRIKIAINTTPENGMISSIFYGVKALTDFAGFLIFPVDHPEIHSATLTQIQNAFIKNPKSVFIPQYQDRSGHPIIIPKHIAKIIPADDYVGGLKGFLKNHSADIHYVPVSDPGVLKNINYPHEL
ncbi:MAG: NTP transferase domain-containing protein [Gammaproteobacteria bacterium]|nr:NTP transferase domain-containing protein [Gammaproteobacteria bacterium]